MMTFKMLPAGFFVLAFTVGRIAFAQEAAKAEADSAPAITSKVPATAVPTFHCLGIYWSPDDGQAGKKVLVKFRVADEKAWHEGLPMRYNPVNNPGCKGDYRGSIVNLKPGTAYRIALTVAGTDAHTSLKATTWDEKFPVASTVKCASG